MKVETSYYGGDDDLRITIYPESSAERALLNVLHDKGCTPELVKAGYNSSDTAINLKVKLKR